MTGAGEAAEMGGSGLLRSVGCSQVVGEGGERRHGAERVPVAVRVDAAIEELGEIVGQV